MSDAITRTFWGGMWMKYDTVPACENARDIILLWDEKIGGNQSKRNIEFMIGF